VVPYIFVDNPMSYLGGREDFGYAKAMGQFQPPSALGTRITLDAFGGDFATGNQASWLPLLEIEEPQAAAGSHAALDASVPEGELRRAARNVEVRERDAACRNQGPIIEVIAGLQKL